MKLIRYEIIENNEVYGFMRGLDDFDVCEESQDILLSGFSELNIPTIYREVRNRNLIAYFTEKGNEYFEQSINNLCKYWQSLGCKVEILNIDMDSSKVLYRDDFQVIQLH